MARAHPHEQNYTCYPGTLSPTTGTCERVKKSGTINILPVNNYVTTHQALVLYHSLPKHVSFSFLWLFLDEKITSLPYNIHQSLKTARNSLKLLMDLELFGYYPEWVPTFANYLF